MNNLEKGKKLFFAMAIIFLILGVATTISSVLVDGTRTLIPGLVRTALEVALLYFVYKGKQWARIIMIVLFIIAFLLMLYITIVFSASILIVLGMLIYGGNIYILAFSPSVKEYLKSVN